LAQSINFAFYHIKYKHILEGNVNKQKISLLCFAAFSISKLILFIEMKWCELAVPNVNL